MGSNLAGRALFTITRYSMFSRGQRVGVAVSGGADSVAQLQVLAELGAQWNLTLHVLHLNHGLRGEQSDGDAEYVREMAAALGVGFSGKRVDVGGTAGNLEERAREARREFFGEAMREHGLARIALGHTRDDQAETVLYRLLRGAGTAGLAGMAPVTPDGYVRPLLECGRDEVLEYLRGRGIGWREDESNRDLRFARNRIRHEVLPLLEKDFHPNLAARLAAVSEMARDEERYWEEEVARWAGLSRRGAAVILDLALFAAAGPALQRRVVRAAIGQAKGDLRGVDLEHVERVRALGLRDRGAGRLQLPGLDVRRSFQWLRLGRPEAAPAPYRVPIEVPGTVEVAGLGVRLDFELVRGGEAGYNKESADLDWETVSGPLELRSWAAGMGCGKSIRDLFQKEKVPSWERPFWPMIKMNDNVIWVRSMGAMDGFAASGDAQWVLRVRETGMERM